ncbi:MAG TPA: protein kinase, partial [candidate division Zixibacteria bacterium]|nr:protein kinase [candidate division Zixibacteria bacterium]
MISDGQQIDQFRIVRKIGSGGMVDVYLAEDQKLGRQVALKFLPPDFFANPERKARFQREARTAAQVTHSNITAIYDIADFTDPAGGGSSQYIVMEYVEGKSLKDYLAATETDMAALLRLAEKIAAGIAAAHRLNIVHRDIKADNILINTDGDPKILDFGLAKAVDERPETTKTAADEGEGETVSKELTEIGKIVGTVNYMSPEQARGDHLDTRSDVFSFGVLLYRMTTGEFPFSGPTQVSTIAKILETQQEAPSAKNERIPTELERIITKCLQKNPSDRYQDTRDLVVDLRELRRKFDSGVTDSVSIEASAPAVRSGPARLLGWPLVVVVVVAGVLGSVFLSNRFGSGDSPGGPIATAAENSIAILDFESSTEESELQWLKTGLPEILLTDLTESRALNVIGRERICDQIRKQTNSPAEFYSREQMREAARELGSAAVIYGSFYRLGDKIRIDARMERTDNGEVLWSHKVAGADQDLFTLVDSLTTKVAAALNISDFMPTGQKVAAVTTFSPDAYRHYHKGLDYFFAELHDEAGAQFDSAIAIDSTFALPYMRKALSCSFTNNRREMIQNFEIAQRFQERLPIRERSLLDIYIDVFMRDDYTSGFSKMDSYIKNYPEDKEARTFYGIFQNLVHNDTAAAFEQYRIVLNQDPGYQFTLSLYSNLLEQYGKTEEAIEIMHRLLTFHPESPEPYGKLIDLYDDLDRTDDAIAAAHRMLHKFPDHAKPLNDLRSLFVQKRQFDSAWYYAELYSQDDTTDNYKLRIYYNTLASLEQWRGRFREALEFYRRAYERALRTEDDAQIYSACLVLAGHFWLLGDTDS